MIYYFSTCFHRETYLFWFPIFKQDWSSDIYVQEYKGITNLRLIHIIGSPPNPSQFAILVRGIPWSPEDSYCDTVKKFFSYYHESSYLSHQIVYKSGAVQKLKVCLFFKYFLLWFQWHTFFFFSGKVYICVIFVLHLFISLRVLSQSSIKIYNLLFVFTLQLKLYVSFIFCCCF